MYHAELCTLAIHPDFVRTFSIIFLIRISKIILGIIRRNLKYNNAMFSGLVILYPVQSSSFCLPHTAISESNPWNIN
jgi:hypothetical protein